MKDDKLKTTLGLITIVVDRSSSREDAIILNLKLPKTLHGKFQTVMKDNRVTMQKFLESFIRLFVKFPESFLIIKRKKKRKGASMAQTEEQNILPALNLAERIGDVSISPKEHKVLAYRSFKIRFVEGENVIHFSNTSRLPLKTFAGILMKHINPKTNEIDTVDFDKEFPLYAIIKDPMLLDVISDALSSLSDELVSVQADVLKQASSK